MIGLPCCFLAFLSLYYCYPTNLFKVGRFNSRVQLFATKLPLTQCPIAHLSDFERKYIPRDALHNYFDIFTSEMIIDQIDVKGEKPIDVIRLPKPFGNIPEENPAARSLYIRPFYSDLFSQCLPENHILLIGNPGTSKSISQMVILASLLAPAEVAAGFHEHSAMKVIRDKLAHIKVIVRQEGADVMDVMFLDQKKQIRTNVINRSIFDHFNSDETLYMFEPRETTTLSPMVVRTKSLSTLSPDTVRYKEYSKYACTKFYMPLYTEEQLVAIGRDMTKQPDFDPVFREIYEEHNIRKHVHDFGGVIRNVLPAGRDVIPEAYKDKKDAISDLTPDRAMHLIKNVRASEFQDRIVLLDVPLQANGSYNFKDYYRYYYPNVIGIIQQYLKELGTMDKAMLLEKVEMTKDLLLTKIARTIMEDLVIAYLTTDDGLQWVECVLDNKTKRNDTNYIPFIHRLDGKIIKDCIKFKDLKAGALVVPNLENLSFAEMYFKGEDELGEFLYCLQIWFDLSKPKKKVSVAALNRFKEMVGDCRIKFVLITPHTMADKAFIGVTMDNKSKVSVKALEKFKSTLNGMMLWKPPSNYYHRFETAKIREEDYE